MRSTKFLPVLAAALILGGCSDSNSPDDVNAESFATNLAAVGATYESNVAFQSLRALSFSFPSFLSADLVRATLPVPPESREGAVTMARSASPALRALLRGPSDVLALFPVDALGKTYEWDAALDTYVEGQRTGAPANGVRILLYVVNQQTGQPLEPVQELGSLELTDESTAQADRLGVVLRLATTVVADYDITVQSGTTSGTATASGYLRRPDGSGRLDFTLVESASLATIGINYQIAAANGSSILLQVQLGAAGATVLFRVSHDGNSIEISGTETQGAVDGLIKYNGVTVATITGDPDDPTITGVGGRTIQASELAALLQLFDGIGSVLDDFSDGIFAPGAVVFGQTS